MKGVMYELFVGLVGIAFVALLFIGLSAAWDGGINAYGRTNIRVNSSSAVDSRLVNNMNIVDTVFTFWPAITIFLFLVYLFVVGQRRGL